MRQVSLHFVPTAILSRQAHWSGVLAMTLCVFVLIASEFMPVSLLTPIAGDLHITEGLAGQVFVVNQGQGFDRDRVGD
ncbi:hypothetical protein FK521_27050, partial [Klebsiella pneumoniae]|nr:hypothetical protein [Klebsiella pneumoniae]